MKVMKKPKFILIITFCLIIILLFLCFIPIKPNNQIKIIFSGLPYEKNELSAETMGKMIIQYNDRTTELQGTVDLEAQSLYEITYVMGDIGKDAVNLSFDLQYDNSKSYIKAIEIYNHMTQVEHFAPSQIIEYFNCGIDEEYYFEGPCIVLTAEDGCPSLIGNEKLQSVLPEILQNDIAIRINMLIWYIIIAGLFMVLLCEKKCIVNIKKNLKSINAFLCWIYERKYYIGIAFLIIVQLLIIIMAIKSKLYAHPDETVTRVAIDYYLGNWLKPSMEGNWVAGTFSPAGYSRLNEDTWYYLIAGKVGWLVIILTHFATYFRALNVILFGIMTGIVVKYGKKESWMFLILLLTPQLWYVFSYATSDAWDFFWGFIITFELVVQESSLNCFLKGKGKNNFWIILWLGFVFSNIFLAKENFYCVLLYAFIVLLFRLFSLSREDLFIQIGRYCKILVSTGGFYLLKKILDIIMNNVDKNIVFLPDQAYPGKVLSAFEAGYTIKDLFTEKSLGKDLFGSFTGAYGWMAHWNSETYTYIVAFLYGAILFVLFSSLFRMRFNERLEVIFLYGTCFLMFVMVVLHCWVNDYQPQGRYMFPVILIIGYLGSKKKEKWQEVLLFASLFLIGVLSIFSYCYVGLRALVL